MQKDEVQMQQLLQHMFKPSVLLISLHRANCSNSQDISMMKSDRCTFHSLKVCQKVLHQIKNQIILYKRTAK